MHLFSLWAGASGARFYKVARRVAWLTGCAKTAPAATGLAVAAAPTRGGDRNLASPGAVAEASTLAHRIGEYSDASLAEGPAMTTASTATTPLAGTWNKHETTESAKEITK